jgi:hypothetical protein
MNNDGLHPVGIRLKAAFSQITICGACLLVAGTAQAQLVNGNLGTGNFTGWTISDTTGPYTMYGLETGGTAFAQVMSADITGNGIQVNCAEFEVGQASGLIGGGGVPQGIIFYQYAPLNAGQLTMSVDIAAYSPANNGDAGTFQLLLDGVPVATDAMGGIPYQALYRSSLSFTGQITGGTHQIGVEITRAYGFAQGDTPYEFLGNFNVTIVPEPASVLLAVVGGGVLLLFRAKSRKPEPPPPNSSGGRC